MEDMIEIAIQDSTYELLKEKAIGEGVSWKERAHQTGWVLIQVSPELYQELERRLTDERGFGLEELVDFDHIINAILNKPITH